MSKVIKLKDIADVITGYPFKGDRYSDKGIRTVRGENITEGKLRWDVVKCWNEKFDKEENYILKEDDVVIGMDGSKVGKNKARIRKGDLPLFLAQRVSCVRAKENNDQLFVFYLINNPRFELYVLKTQTGSSIPHISKTQIEDFEVPHVDLLTQQKIGSILSALDDKIELNNRINGELEQIVKMLYDYWFVQFDFPDKKGSPYKSSKGKIVYNEVLKKDIPQGWIIEALSEINSELVRGISPTYAEDYGIPIINQKCIRNNTVDFSFCRFHNVQSKPVTKLIQIGDILVNSTGVGTLGRVAIVKRLENPQTTVDSHVTIVRANNDKINPIFLGVSLLNRQTEIEKLGEGSTGQTELSRENLGKLKILLPKRELQNEFASIVKPLFEKVAVNEQQNQQLSALRDWLLPMLMNGQVKVVDDKNTKNSNPSIAVEPEIICEKKGKLNIPDSKKGFAKQVLAGKIISLFKDDPNFTDIKFQKLQFLAEHISEADLGMNYYYQAAGPYDNKFMHTIYNDFRKQKWFDCQKKKIIALEKQDKIEGYYQGYFAPVQKQLDKLFNLLYKSSEAEAEIIATVYAVWNNRIIEKKTTFENELLEDFYQWSDRKQQYKKDQILSGLQWLKDNQMEPKGFGKLIKKAKSKK